MELGDRVTLPLSKKIMPNRFFKAPMSEHLATFNFEDSSRRGKITKELITLYGAWGEGEIGMIISGNVMIHRDHLESTHNIVVEASTDDENRANLKEMAVAAKRHGSLLVAQIGHPGRQTPSDLQPHPVSSSNVPPHYSETIPHPLSAKEIQETVQRFADAAKVLRDCGWDGVELHAAHGYLLSLKFL
eukprot:TRINITY_DN4204_c1_g1_i3.p1 TRINITY_DN4204_c1_g1~~TRINITY_DN4204_c1_g1_i3.p1  ORF type:complete len:188 (-),score=28.41 TRINITY_DN4204_c1_g1_i3:682-1245(-)